jgi:hypothetical protein
VSEVALALLIEGTYAAKILQVSPSSRLTSRRWDMRATRSSLNRLLPMEPNHGRGTQFGHHLRRKTRGQVNVPLTSTTSSDGGLIQAWNKRLLGSSPDGITHKTSSRTRTILLQIKHDIRAEDSAMQRVPLQ